MPNHSNDTGARIQNAYSACQHDKNIRITQAAREFDVPYYRLRSRLRGHNQKPQSAQLIVSLIKPRRMQSSIGFIN